MTLVLAISYSACATTDYEARGLPNEGLGCPPGRPTAYLREIRIAGQSGEGAGLGGSEDLARVLRSNCAFESVRVGGPDRALRAGEVYLDIGMDLDEEVTWAFSQVLLAVGRDVPWRAFRGKSGTVLFLGMAAIGLPVLAIYAVVPVTAPTWGTMHGWAHVRVAAPDNTVLWEGEVATDDAWQAVVYPLWRKSAVLNEARRQAFYHLSHDVAQKIVALAAPRPP